MAKIPVNKQVFVMKLVGEIAWPNPYIESQHPKLESDVIPTFPTTIYFFSLYFICK